MAERWQVTACADGNGVVYVAVGDEAWQAPDGTVHATLDALEEAVGECTPTQVARPDLLVAEVLSLQEQTAWLAEENAQLAARVSALTSVAFLADAALAGASTRCGLHKADLQPTPLCCRHPRAVVRAREALRRALPPPEPTAG